MEWIGMRSWNICWKCICDTTIMFFMSFILVSRNLQRDWQLHWPLTWQHRAYKLRPCDPFLWATWNAGHWVPALQWPAISDTANLVSCLWGWSLPFDEAITKDHISLFFWFYCCLLSPSIFTLCVWLENSTGIRIHPFSPSMTPWTQWGPHVIYCSWQLKVRI